MLPRRRWQDMTSRDFAAAAAGGWIAVLPMAAIEQHGPHLPVSTDTAIAEGLIAAAVDRLDDDLPVTFLPVLAYGKSNEHIVHPGTLTLSWETLTRAVVEIGESVARAGVRKLVIVNAHGGNVPVIDIATRELRVRHGMLAVATAWSRFGYPENLFPTDELTYGIHGGALETSVMLHLAPGLVRMEMAVDFRSAQEGYAKDFAHLRAHGPHAFGWRAEDLNPQGVVGDAAAATAEKGRSIVERQAAAFVALCRDVHAFDIATLHA